MENNPTIEEVCAAEQQSLAQEIQKAFDTSRRKNEGTPENVKKAIAAKEAEIIKSNKDEATRQILLNIIRLLSTLDDEDRIRVLRSSIAYYGLEEEMND